MNDTISSDTFSQLNDQSQLCSESLTYEAYGDGLLPDFQSCPRSEPLVRYGSSDGSSYTSSTPTSPMSNNSFYTHQASPPRSSPYIKFLEMATPLTAYYGSPDLGTGQEFSCTEKTWEDSQSGSILYIGRDYPVCCLHPGCNAKPFKRRADLDRHYKHKHAPESVKESYYCDYSRCSRRRDPFHRRDHFRDHLRDFHKEDIEKRGVALKEEWFENRNAANTWWRCTKCLKRIYISRYGYGCPTCKTCCQARRKEIRRRD